MKNLIKKWFNLYDEQDIESALANTPSVQDRDQFIWKFKLQLFRRYK